MLNMDSYVRHDFMHGWCIVSDSRVPDHEKAELMCFFFKQNSGKSQAAFMRAHIKSYPELFFLKALEDKKTKR